MKFTNRFSLYFSCISSQWTIIWVRGPLVDNKLLHNNQSASVHKLVSIKYICSADVRRNGKIKEILSKWVKNWRVLRLVHSRQHIHARRRVETADWNKILGLSFRFTHIFFGNCNAAPSFNRYNLVPARLNRAWFTYQKVTTVVSVDDTPRFTPVDYKKKTYSNFSLVYKIK